MVNDSLRYFGCAVGFGFGVLWMTEGLGAAILCVLLAGLGYGGVFLAERARANPGTLRLPKRTPAAEDLSVKAEELGLDQGYVYEPSDATSPLAAEVEYGWPVAEPEIAHTQAG
jgi:hypothetical protein